MTETEWLASPALRSALDYLRGKNSPRKTLLFACRCADLLSPYLQPRCREALRLVEQGADALPDRTTLQQARQETSGVWYEIAIENETPAFESPRTEPIPGMAEANWVEAVLADTATLRVAPFLPEDKQVEILRELFGNPFHRLVVDPHWLTPDVLPLARGIYADRAFDRMPILADALEEAGCTQEEILSHLRGPGPHGRGCWVVDLLTGRS